MVKLDLCKRTPTIILSQVPLVPSAALSLPVRHNIFNSFSNKNLKLYRYETDLCVKY